LEAPASVPPPPRRAFPRISGAIGLLLISFVLTIALTVPVAIATPKHSVARFLASSAAQVLALGFIIRIGYRRSGSSSESVFPLRSVPSWFVGAWFLLFAGGFLLTVDLGVLLQKVWTKPESFRVIDRELLSGSGTVVGAFLVVVLIGPVMEELLFRGVILHGFLANYPRRTAIVTSAALFGLYHLNPWQAVPAFVVGLLFASWRVTTGSLWPGIAGHVLGNSVPFFAQLLRPDSHRPLAVPPVPAAVTAGLGVTALVLLGAGTGLLRRFRPRQAEVPAPLDPFV